MSEIITTYTPASEEEAAEVLRECSQAGHKVRIRGGGTKDWLGNSYAPTEAVISTQKLDDLIDYQPEDLTITVGAGMPFARLQEILGEQGQFLPLDPRDLRGQTIGGILATNRSGPRRLLYGTARDLLIGCRFVLSDGTIGHSGGRVVKNVAGYDLHKLFIGSMGTLGLLTEVTFKVVPKPQTVAAGTSVFPNYDAAFTAARQCVRSNLMPSALEILFGDNDLNLVFSAEGTQTAVTGQVEGLAAICQQARATKVVIVDAATSQAILKTLSTEDPELGAVVLRAATTLTELPKITKSFESLLKELDLSGSIRVRAGTGIAYLYLGETFESPGRTKLMANAAALIELIGQLRAGLLRDGGSLVIERAPAEIKQGIDVWGPLGDAGPMMRALKQKLDPAGLLNPGVMDLERDN